MGTRHNNRKNAGRPRSHNTDSKSSRPTSAAPAQNSYENIADAILNQASIQEIAEIIAADLNALEVLDSFKRHPLEMAAIHNRADVIDLLVKHHADVNKKGPSGYTPLHRACMWGAKQAVEALLKHNANPMSITLYPVNGRKETPSDTAQRYSHYGCVDLIQTEIARRELTTEKEGQ